MLRFRLTLLRTNTHIHACTQTHTYTHAHKHTYTRLHTNTRTPTHTPTQHYEACLKAWWSPAQQVLHQTRPANQNATITQRLESGARQTLAPWVLRRGCQVNFLDNTDTYTYIHTPARTCAKRCSCPQMQAPHAHIYKRLHGLVHTYTHAMHTSRCRYVHIHVRYWHMHVHACTHARTHACANAHTLISVHNECRVHVQFSPPFTLQACM